METNTQRLIHTFATLADLGQEIANTADFEEMLRASFHLLLGSLAIRRGAVAEYDRRSEQLRFVATRGLGQNIALPLDHDHARELALSGSALSLDDALKGAQRFLEDHQASLAAIEIDLLLPLVILCVSVPPWPNFFTMLLNWPRRFAEQSKPEPHPRLLPDRHGASAPASRTNARCGC